MTPSSSPKKGRRRRTKCTHSDDGDDEVAEASSATTSRLSSSSSSCTVPSSPSSASNSRSRIRRRVLSSRSHRSPTTPLIAAILCSLLLLLSASLWGSPRWSCHGVEIEYSDEWQLLGENDTLPAGMHIRIDMTTGEKWAKRMTPEDGEAGGVGGEVDEGEDPTSSNRAVSVRATEDDNDNEEEGGLSSPPPKPRYDYMAMHRALSKIPPSELGDMESLPDVPSDASTPEERAAFDEEMDRIWTTRQEELKKLQEEALADLPSVLQGYLDILTGFWNGRAKTVTSEKGGTFTTSSPNEGATKDDDYLDANADADAEADDVDDAEQAPSDGVVDLEVDDVLNALSELEYLLSDIDLARDFYVLGGWPVLVSYLSPPPWLWGLSSSGGGVGGNVTDGDGDGVHDEELRRRMEGEKAEMQKAASWAVGTAVKNHAEFASWAVEPVTVVRDNVETSATAVSLLLDLFRPSTHDRGDGGGSCDASTPATRKKALYALGALLRGNPTAQGHFVLDLHGTEVLGSALEKDLADGGGGDLGSASKMLSLARDLTLEAEQRMATPPLASSSGGSSDADAPEDDDDDDQDDSVRSDEAMVGGFASGPWCRSATEVLRRQAGGGDAEGAGEAVVVGVKTDYGGLESTLVVLKTMVPHCDDFGEMGEGGGDDDAYRIVSRVRSDLESAETVGGVVEEEDERDDDADDDGHDGATLDPEWRDELVDLAGSVLEAMEGRRR